MKTKRLRSPFEVGAVPLPKYPRPQFERDSYMCLNGKWNYGIYRKNERFSGYQGEILVPFSPESLLSGLPEKTLVTPEDTLYYQRVFSVETQFLRAKTLLHFDAVDYECKVILNGKAVGGHQGGFTPFTLDVTTEIVTGINSIEVIVNDPSDTSYHTRGKQALEHGKIWYTPQSGIWQSVWIESVDIPYLRNLAITPDIDNDCVMFKLDSDGADAEIVVLDGQKVVGAANCVKNSAIIRLAEYELWSPENPKLYDVAVKVGSDVVRSYFGMRKFSIVKDKSGVNRLGLNNKPYFMSGVLDQGYWSDGMLTPPSDDALEYDIRLIKSMGFNMIRKHIKIEPLRWYYHCDKEGIIVWQDMVSGGAKYKFSVIGTLPFLGIHLKDNNYKRFARKESESRDEYMRDMHDTVDTLKNCVSIGVWVPFNEGWGQFDSVEVTKNLRKIDNTRIIDSVSGWHDQGKTSSELKSLHVYFKPIRIPKDPRCIVLSEFGGFSIPTEGHVYSPDKSFGYKLFKSPKAFADAFVNIYEKSVVPNIAKGLSAAVYTQVSDVEEEINGLVTYDRKVVKIPVERVKAVNKKLKIEE